MRVSYGKGGKYAVRRSAGGQKPQHQSKELTG